MPAPSPLIVNGSWLGWPWQIRGIKIQVSRFTWFILVLLTGVCRYSNPSPNTDSFFHGILVSLDLLLYALRIAVPEHSGFESLLLGVLYSMAVGERRVVEGSSVVSAHKAVLRKTRWVLGCAGLGSEFKAGDLVVSPTIFVSRLRN